MKPQIRVGIAVTAVLALTVGGIALDRYRQQSRSLLSGYFENEPVQVASRTSGRVRLRPVHEGDAVAKDQLLIELESDPAIADLGAKRATATQAERAYEEAKNGSRPQEIARQEAVVAEARATLERLRNGPLPEEIAAARDKLEQAESRYAKAIRGPRKQEIDEARAAERQANAALSQAKRGATPEERGQLKAKLDAAETEVERSRRESVRNETLAAQGAVSGQRAENARAAYDSALAHAKEAQEAYDRALRGTPAEELEQAVQAHQRASASLRLVLAGTRREDLEAARADVSIARENLKLLLRGTRAEDIAAGASRLQQAQALLDELKVGNRHEMIAQAKAAANAAQLAAKGSALNVQERNVLAPTDGVIEKLLVREGDLVSAGTPVAQLVDPKDIWLRVFILESDLAKVKVGDAAELKVDGIPSLVEGVVESVATRAEFTPAGIQTPEERGRQVFGVRIRLRSFDSRVKPGIYATVKRLGQWQ